MSKREDLMTYFAIGAAIGGTGSDLFLQEMSTLQRKINRLPKELEAKQRNSRQQGAKEKARRLKRMNHE